MPWGRVSASAGRDPARAGSARAAGAARRRATQRATSTTDTTRLGARRQLVAPEQDERHTQHPERAHGEGLVGRRSTGATAARAGCRRTTAPARPPRSPARAPGRRTPRAGRRVDASSHGRHPSRRGRTSSASTTSAGGRAYPPASATRAAGDPSSARAREAARSSSAGAGGRVGEVLLDGGAQLGAPVLGQDRRLGVEAGQPGPHLGVVQPVHRRTVVRHARQRSGPRGRSRKGPRRRRGRSRDQPDARGRGAAVGAGWPHDDDRLGRDARARPDAALRRRDLGDRVGAHGGCRPRHRRARRALVERPDLRRARVALRPRRARRPASPAATTPTRVRVDDVPVWPRAGMPASRIRTLDPEPRAALRVRHLPHDGVRTTRRATATTGSTPCAASPWPCATTPRRGGPTCCCCSVTRSTPTPPRTRSSRSSWPPGAASTSRRAPEIKDFVEYAELYRLAWSDDVIRWVLSTRALGDDLRRPRHPRRLEHLVVVAARDPHDDVVAGAHRLRPRRRTGCTSTSATSRRPSWPRRRCGAAWPRTRPPGATDELDLTEPLDALAARADAEPDDVPVELHPRARATARSSSSTPAPPASCGRTAARCSTREEMRWLDGVLRGGVRHLFIGTSLPFLLPAGPARLRGDERGDGPGRLRPRRGSRAAEKLRRTHRPRALGRLQRGLRRGVRAGHGGGARRARPGAADDHLPLRRRAQLLPRRGHRPAAARARSRACVQAVCSPIRNPMPRARAGRHVAVREVARAARCGSSRPARRGCPTPPTPGRSPTGRGSTTTSRWSRRAREALELDLGRPASSRATPTARGCSRCMPRASTRCPAAVGVALRVCSGLTTAGGTPGPSPSVGRAGAARGTPRVASPDRDRARRPAPEGHP